MKFASWTYDGFQVEQENDIFYLEFLYLYQFVLYCVLYCILYCGAEVEGVGEIITPRSS